MKLIFHDEFPLDETDGDIEAHPRDWPAWTDAESWAINYCWTISTSDVMAGA